MKRTNTVLGLLLLSAALCMSASAAQAQAQPCPWVFGNFRAPPGAGDWSYSSGYSTCETNGYTGRSWLTGYAAFQGWSTVSGRRSNFCGSPSEPNMGMYIAGEAINWNTGTPVGMWRSESVPSGCTIGTGLSQTMPIANTYFYHSSCGIGIGPGCTVPGSGMVF
jgi:hypothetical protein